MKGRPTQGIFTLPEKIWETADGRGVPDGHPDAKSLVGPAGKRIPAEKAVSLGLSDGTSGIKPGLRLAERMRVVAEGKKLEQVMDGRSADDPVFRDAERRRLELSEIADENGFNLANAEQVDEASSWLLNTVTGKCTLIRRPAWRQASDRPHLTPRGHERTHQPRSSSPRARTSTTAGRDDGEDDDPDPDHPDPFGSAPTGALDDDELVAELLRAIDRWERGL